MITIVTPVYNEKENLEELFSRIDDALSKINQQYEILFVDNGSEDGSLEVIKNLKKKNSQVKFISLTKNYGHQGGIWAGIYHTNSTCIIMDADLQHPPETIVSLIKKWSEGYKVVNTRKILDKDKRIWKKALSNFFYKIVNRLTNLNLSSGQSDFCLIDNAVLNIIKKLPEKKIFIRGIINSLGFNTSTIDYHCDARKKGKSKFSIMEYLNLAFDGIISFSSIPATIFFWIGIIVALSCIGYAFYLLSIIYFTSADLLPPGWATITVAVLFLGGIQLIGLGILGKYIALILENIKKRPEFIIKEKSE